MIVKSSWYRTDLKTISKRCEMKTNFNGFVRTHENYAVISHQHRVNGVLVRIVKKMVRMVVAMVTITITITTIMKITMTVTTIMVMVLVMVLVLVMVIVIVMVMVMV